MKRFIILSICWYITASCYSQNYIAEYDSNLETGVQGTSQFLLFNSNEWRYDTTDTTRLEITITGGYMVDSQEESLSEDPIIAKQFNYRSLDKNYYLDEEMLYSDLSLQNKCVIKGELVKPEWTIVSDSVKTIEDYTCLMAKGHVRGRDYSVWFTPDIPVSAGPWKLWGLPGLIVNAQSDDKKVYFQMTSLKKTDTAIEEPMVGKTVTHEEFKPLFNDAFKKFSRSIRSVLSSGSETTTVDVKLTEFNHPDKSLLE